MVRMSGYRQPTAAGEVGHGADSMRAGTMVSLSWYHAFFGYIRLCIAAAEDLTTSAFQLRTVRA